MAAAVGPRAWRHDGEPAAAASTADHAARNAGNASARPEPTTPAVLASHTSLHQRVAAAVATADTGSLG